MIYLSHDFDVRLQKQKRSQSLTEKRVIIGDYQADWCMHFYKSVISISRRAEPLPLTFKRPPNSATRDAIAQGGVSESGNPTPSSSMVILTLFSASNTLMFTQL